MNSARRGSVVALDRVRCFVPWEKRLDRRRIVILIMVSVLFGSGCGQQPGHVPATEPPTQRFLHVQPSANVLGVPFAAFALDTKTGLLCKTYPVEGWANVPQCVDVYAKYPDSQSSATH